MYGFPDSTELPFFSCLMSFVKIAILNSLSGKLRSLYLWGQLLEYYRHLLVVFCFLHFYVLHFYVLCCCLHI